MIRELLLFSRPQPLRMELLSLCDELRRAVALLKGKLDKSAILLELDCAPGLPGVSADANQVQQVFLNLIINACDAMSVQAGPRRLVITARSTPASATGHRGIAISFQDNGPGIPPAIVDRIFDPFVTTKEAGKGTGLGLAVCKRIMDQHRGSIETVVREDGGAVFVLHFTVDSPAA
jgi:signal transduction histidine kinase